MDYFLRHIIRKFILYSNILLIICIIIGAFCFILIAKTASPIILNQQNHKKLINEIHTQDLNKKTNINDVYLNEDNTKITILHRYQNSILIDVDISNFKYNNKVFDSAKNNISPVLIFTAEGYKNINYNDNDIRNHLLNEKYFNGEYNSEQSLKGNINNNKSEGFNYDKSYMGDTLQIQRDVQIETHNQDNYMQGVFMNEKHARFIVPTNDYNIIQFHCNWRENSGVNHDSINYFILK